MFSIRSPLDSWEIELTTTSSGEEGLKIIPKPRLDLVIMDARMGGLNGLEPCDVCGRSTRRCLSS